VDKFVFKVSPVVPFHAPLVSRENCFDWMTLFRDPHPRSCQVVSPLLAAASTTSAGAPVVLRDGADTQMDEHQFLLFLEKFQAPAYHFGQRMRRFAGRGEVRGWWLFVAASRRRYRISPNRAPSRICHSPTTHDPSHHINRRRCPHGTTAAGGCGGRAGHARLRRQHRRRRGAQQVPHFNNPRPLLAAIYPHLAAIYPHLAATYPYLGLYLSSSSRYLCSASRCLTSKKNVLRLAPAHARDAPHPAAI